MGVGLAELAMLFAVPLVAGIGVLSASGIPLGRDRLGILGYGYAFGALLVAVAIWCLAATGAPLQAGVITGAALAAAGLLMIAGRRWGPRDSGALEPPLRHFPAWERAVFVVVLAIAAVVLLDEILLSAARVVVYNDEGSFWAPKAKAIYHAGGFNAEFRRETGDVVLFPHVDYPPLNPLLQVWTFACAEGITHWENRLPIQGFMLALLLILASVLRRYLRPSAAAFLLLLFVTTGRTLALSCSAFADGLVACGLLVAAAGWLRWAETGSKAGLGILSGGLAILVWSKNEGQLLSLVLTASAATWILVAHRRRFSPLLLASLLPPLLLLAAHLAWKRHFDLENDLVGRAGGSVVALVGRVDLSRAPAVLSYLLHEVVLSVEESNLVFLVFFGVLLFFPRLTMRGPSGVVVLTVLGGFVGYVLVYCASHWHLQTHLETSAERIAFHLLPATYLCLAVVLPRLHPPLAARARE